jgi:hypothetical protein
VQKVENRQNRGKVAKMPCISVISIGRRLRKWGLKTFQGGTTQKVVNFE